MSGEVESIGLIELVKRMLSRRTLPHIALVALVSTGLMVLTGIDEGLAAVMVLSFSIAYLVVAFSSGSELMEKLTTLPEEKQEGGKFIRMLKSFKITTVPVLIALVLTGVLWSVLGDNSEWLVLGLGFLFIAWSIAQAVSFRSGMVEWLSNGLGDAQLNNYREKLSTTFLFIVVQTFAILIIWAGQIISSVESLSFGEAMRDGALFLVASVAVQAAIMWWTKEERELAGSEKGLSAFSFKWMVISQVFITWHGFSIYRKTVLNASPTSNLIEEGLLMAITVLFAVWGLTTHTVKDGERLVGEDAALPLGIAFGYAYAGSVAMLTTTFENITTVMVIGHTLTIITIVFLMRGTLRNRRGTSQLSQLARTISIDSEE
ncbi:MAG: hypothetical protein CXT71_07210 [Methanobacteriota archaeon]|nr:MAG: hypothetical protein CXT71_07210 [Euryarchaeota archaeon]